MKIVVTVVGHDRVGIIAMVSKILAENKVNILNINQILLKNISIWVLIGDMSGSIIELSKLQDILKKKGMEIGLQIKAQHEDIFRNMHRI